MADCDLSTSDPWLFAGVGMNYIWDAFKRRDQSDPKKSSSQLSGGVGTAEFPDTPYSYGESQPWLKHAVDASWWYENGHFLMAARVGRRAVELAPPDQMSNASVDFRMALDELGDGAEGEAEAISVLSDTVIWLLRSGWLDEAWPSPIEAPSEQASAAWSIFPAAGISLIKRAEAARRSDILDAYVTEIVDRLNPMIAGMAWMYGEWLRNYQARC
jgi:hypothetical protein